MYRYAASLKDELLLSVQEVYDCRTLVLMWFGAAGIGLSCIILALILPSEMVPYSGFAFSLLGVWFPLIG